MTTINSNLPIRSESTDSADRTKRFFNNYYDQKIAISSNALDSTVGFFRSKGFSETAANSVSSVLLSQSKSENINVFQLLDTLRGLNDLQLSRVVTEILNYNRLKISNLGYRINNSNKIQFEKRNLII